MTMNISDATKAGIGAAKALETAGDFDGAIDRYEALVESLGDNHYDAAVVLHMFAIAVEDPARKLSINEEALRRAEQVPGAGFPKPLFASLYANVGYSKIGLGDLDAARECYLRAEAVAAGLDDDDYGENVRSEIQKRLADLG